MTLKSTISGHWKFPIYFLGALALTFAAQVLCYFLISDGFWSWRILFGGAFQAVILIGTFLFCSRPSWLLTLIFVVETEFLICDGLKVRYLNTSLLPRDILLLPEFFPLIHTLTPLKQAGFYALLLLLPLTWAGGLLVLIRHRRQPKSSETLWLVPFLALALWLAVFPGSYRRTFASFIGDEPIMRRMRGETYGRVLSLSMELAEVLEEYGHTPDRKEVAAAQQWFLNLSPTINPLAIRSKPDRNIYILIVESFWDPDRLLAPNIKNGKPIPYLAPEFIRLWAENGSRLLFSPIYGSGTANTEFELLCGIPTAATSLGIVFVEGLTRHLPCLPQLLRENGYVTFAFHPNKPAYYNRDKQFPAIGFDRFFSIDDFRTDQMAGPFLADESFIRQSIEMARKNSTGKPFLAYLMTLAGHWPYPWSDSLYPHLFQIRGGTGKGTNKEDNDEVEHELDINHYTSKVIADTLDQLSREDPDALIVVTGDHLPTTAFTLASAQGAQPGFLTDPVWFETPLLYLDRKERSSQSIVAAFEVGNRIMDSIGIPPEARQQFRYFGRIGGDLVRPVAPGKVFRLRPGGVELCNSTSSSSSCSEQVQWFKHARSLGADLARGKQFSLGR